MQQVRILAERGLAALVAGDGDLVLFCEFDQLRAAGQVPFAPRADHLDVRLQAVVAELEANLIIALAGGAVCDSVRAQFLRNLDLSLGDQRPRNGGAQQVGAFIDRVGAEHREDVVADELLPQVLDIDMFDAEQFGLGARRFQLLALTQVRRKGDDLAFIGGLQPFQDDRCIQPA